MLHKFASLWFVLFVILAISGCESEDNFNFDADAFEQDDPNALFFVMGSGFDHPIVYESYMTNGNYGACGAYYFTGYCHNGNDMIYPRGTNIYSLAAGTVIKVSGKQNPSCSSFWGYDYGYNNTCNMALAVQHYDDDGNPFVAVYGHLIYNPSIVEGTTFTPGQIIGRIGRWYHVGGTRISSDHLHFGIFPGTSAPTYWGRVPCGTSQAASSSLPGGCSSLGAAPPGDYLNAWGREWRSPPFSPALNYPKNVCITGGTSTELDWTNGSGTYRVHIMVCTSPTLTSGCINPDGNMVGVEPTSVGEYRPTSYTVTGLSPYTTYYWAVRGIAYNDYGGWGPYSNVEYFYLIP